MRSRFALLALLAALVLAVAGCTGDPPSASGSGVPSTTADAGPDPTTAPPTTRKASPETTRQAPNGVIPASERQPAPDIQVTAFDLEAGQQQLRLDEVGVFLQQGSGLFFGVPLELLHA